MRTLKIAALATLALISTLVAQDQWGRPVTVPNKVAFKAMSFQLEDVRLLDGPFKDAMIRDQNELLKLDPDRMLHMFRVTAGLPSTAEPLGGWESPTQELRGHTMGHYLSAVAIMYASTGDRRFKDRGDLLVGELAKIQTADATKYIRATSRRFLKSSSIASTRARRSGRRGTRFTRSWPGCSTCTSRRTTRRRSTCSRNRRAGSASASIV